MNVMMIPFLQKKKNSNLHFCSQVTVCDAVIHALPVIYFIQCFLSNHAAQSRAMITLATSGLTASQSVMLVSKR